MGKLVRVLVVVCLLLSIGALVLGIQLFGKRELLKGRTQKLETAIIQLGALIEDEAPRGDSGAQYPERDISPTTLDFLDNPEFSTFWSSYSNSYETADVPTMNIKRRENELATYYKRTAEGKITKDARGLKVTPLHAWASVCPLSRCWISPVATFHIFTATPESLCLCEAASNEPSGLKATEVVCVWESSSTARDFAASKFHSPVPADAPAQAKSEPSGLRATAVTRPCSVSSVP